MGVTFAAPVSSSSGTVSLTGVTVGQPIVLICEFSGPTNAISDNFMSPYTWTQVDQVSIFSSAGGRTVYKTTFIGTGGWGSSGGITDAAGSYLTAIACAGASGANGLSAIDVHGSNSGSGGTISSPSLTPSAANEGAIMAGLAAEFAEFVFINGGPGSPWNNTLYAPFSGSPTYTASGVALYPGAPTSSLSVSWGQTNTYSWSDTNWLALGLVVKAFTATTPSAPTNELPANASFVDASGGLSFQALYNPTDNTLQSFYSLRLKLSGGTYGYWNGTNFSNTTQQWVAITTIPGQAFSVTIPYGVAVPGGTFTNGHTYNFSFASEESAGSLQGSFASDFTFTTQAGPVTTVSAPSGSVHGTTQPTVVWSSTYPSGGVTQTAFRVIVESGSYGSVPGSGIEAWDSGVVASTSLSEMVGTPLTPGMTYRAFVQVTETGPEVGAWAYTTFTLLVDTPAAPTVTAVATTDGVTGLPEVAITVQANDNELTANQSSLENDATTGWTAGASSLIAVSSVWAQDGSYSLQIERTSSTGQGQAFTPTGVSGVPCVAGEVVRALASFHSPATVRGCQVQIWFYNAAGTLLSSITSPSTNSTLTGNGGQAFLSTTAPANAAFMSLTLIASGMSAGEFIYADQMLLGPGTSTTWTVGGFVGITSITVLRSDGQYVRSAGWPSGTSLAVPANTQFVTVNDTEAAPGAEYTYSAVVSTSTLTGPASAASAEVTVNTEGWWWLFDPTNPESLCVQFTMKSNWQPIVLESGATYKPIGGEFMIKSTDGTKGVGGIIPIYTGLDLANGQAAELMVQQDQPLCFMTPTRGIYYVMSDPGTNQRGNVTPWWEVDQPQGEWQFYVIQTSRP